MDWIRDEIALLFSQLHNPVVLQRIECSGLHLNAETQVRNAEAFWDLTVASASERSWFMLSYSHTMPEMWAGLLDTNTARARDSLTRFVEMGKAVIEAKEAMQDPNNHDRVAPSLIHNLSSEFSPNNLSAFFCCWIFWLGGQFVAMCFFQLTN